MQDAEELSRKAEKRKKALERRLRKEAELREQEELPMEIEDTDEEEGDTFTRTGENIRELSWIWTTAGTSGTDVELEDGML
jgi:hypothetical protein